ncbi:hypothetical protein O181_103356 [Austropuccinia psidii MF-1]|uniref:Uncharacterized protein n=1 Tax=Austropuccinia psidii MF-1 TaxID=1389203 RepID=A0A9Q3JKE5_9BASI|nr:hypothetical protein [Austropuccinia psidii MF-1]
MKIEDPEKWLVLELRGMNEADEEESLQKKFKMDVKPPEANSSGIAEDYLNLFQDEMGIPEDHMDQVWDRDMKRRIRQRMETVLEDGKLVESEDDLILYQQKNKNSRDKFKQRRRFEDLEEGELSENTQRIAGLTILEPNPQN